MFLGINLVIIVLIIELFIYLISMEVRSSLLLILVGSGIKGRKGACLVQQSSLSNGKKNCFATK